jgi:monomeric isocitrate dehydrogenase
MKPQLPGMMFLISSSEPTNPSKPLGKSPDPVLSRHFYQDNSLSKATKSKISFKAKISQLHPKELQLSKQSLITAKYSSARAYQEKVEEIISNSYKIHNLSILKLHQSAIKIQKHVKGYLARKRFEDFYLEYKENHLEYLINSLENLSFQTFFKLGTNTLPVFCI